MTHRLAFIPLACFALAASAQQGGNPESDAAPRSRIIYLNGGPSTGANRALGTVQAGPFSVEGDVLLGTLPADNRCLGVDIAWGSMWVTGGGDFNLGVWDFKIHKFDMNGNYIASYPQVTNATSWGGRDIYCDEATNTFYTGSNGGELSIYDYDPVTGGLTHNRLVSIGGVTGTLRALCRNPNTGTFFTQDFGSPPQEFDLTTGQVINTFPSNGLSVYGMGWDPNSGTIWASHTSSTFPMTVYEIDPVTGGITNNSFAGVVDAWGTGNLDIQGGLDVFVNASGGLSVAMLHQTAPDAVVIYELTSVPTTPPALTLTNFAAGQLGSIDIANCTPGGFVITAYSLTGPGPISFPIGTVSLSAPIYTLPAFPANGNGDYMLPIPFPPGITGLQVWVQALDIGSITFSNGAFTVFQ